MSSPKRSSSSSKHASSNSRHAPLKLEHGTPPEPSTFSEYFASLTQSSSKTPHYYAVYRAKFNSEIDPDYSDKARSHDIIFVESEPEKKAGIKFHVTGDVKDYYGMTYNSEACGDPSTSKKFRSSELIGYTPADGFWNDWESLLTIEVPTPPMQKAWNPATGKTEVVKSWNGPTFFEPGERRPPNVPWKCTEWTNLHAIPALCNAGLILETIPAEPIPTETVGAAASIAGPSWEAMHDLYWSESLGEFYWR